MDDAVSTGRAQVVRYEGATVLTVVEEIDIATAGALRRTVLELLDERPKTLVVDLRLMSFVGSSGISVLVGAVHRADRLGVHLAVVTAGRCVGRALEITRADELVTVYRCPAEASSFVPKPRGGAEVPSMPGVR